MQFIRDMHFWSGPTWSVVVGDLFVYYGWYNNTNGWTAACYDNGLIKEQLRRGRGECAQEIRPTPIRIMTNLQNEAGALEAAEAMIPDRADLCEVCYTRHSPGRGGVLCSQ